MQKNVILVGGVTMGLGMNRTWSWRNKNSNLKFDVLFVLLLTFSFFIFIGKLFKYKNIFIATKKEIQSFSKFFAQFCHII